MAATEDPGHAAELVPHGFVDEVEEAFLRLGIGRAPETSRNVMGDKALA
jgi:hypothetical protein